MRSHRLRNSGGRGRARRMSAAQTPSPAGAFAIGLKAAAKSVFIYVMFGTFIGYGALCHDLGFSLAWALISTVLIWAGPAQVIVVTALGSGLSAGEAAIAVSLSGIRLLPMVA